jgi:tetratricopeptide (TPR) repeat protein
MDEVFVGRRDEQARFSAVLAELAPGAARRSGRWRRRGDSAAGPAGAAVSRVVLVHGLGGSGKSRLLGCFRDMAAGSAPNSPVRRGQVLTAWLDWEDEQRDDPGSYAAAEGPGLVTVLNAVQAAVLRATGQDARARERAERAFGDYRQGAAQMPEYAARFADVLAQSQQSGSPFSSQDAAVLLKAAMSAGLVAGGHPGGLLGLSPGQLSAAAQAGGHLSTTAARAVTGRNAGQISASEYDLVADPARELTRRMAAAMRAAAAGRPLVVFLDTGEVIGDRAWGWLRHVMAGTGARVAWVVGARFETEAEAGADSPVARFVRDIGDAHLMLMSPTRFDDAMIRAYLDSRLGGHGLGDEQLDMIARFTRGLPLAVSLTATLLGQGQRAQDVCQETGHGHPGSVVSQLARRYLVHAERQQHPAGDPRRDDVMRILGLALAYGDVRGDPDLLAALWDTADPLAAFTELARRHDFVLPISRRLHDDVRDTLRADLLDPYRRARARPVSERALVLLGTRLATMRGRWPTLDEQLGHTEYTTTVLATLWHTLWTGNQAGLDLLIQILPVLCAAHSPSADAAVAMTGQFEPTFGHDQRRDLDLLSQLRTGFFLGDWPAGRQETHARTARRARITLDGLALPLPGPAASTPAIGAPEDRDVAVLILRAGIQAENHDDRSAIATLREAAAQTSSTRLRQAIGSRADIIARRLIWAGPGNTSVPSPAGLEAAELATSMRPDLTSAWHTYAAALNKAGRNEEALAAHDQAITLDPRNAIAHSNRGIVLRALGRHQDALAAYDQAITLDPRNVGAHIGREISLLALGRHQDALAAYDQAITLDPRNAGAHNSRGIVLRALGRYQDALAAYDQAITLDPRNAIAHSNRGIVLRALGRHQDALAAYDQAITLDPRDGSAHENKGITLAAAGDFGAALAELDTADRLDPEGAGEGRAWAAAILWHQREPAGARELFELVEGRVTGCTPFHTAEMEAIALCGLGQPGAAERRLLGAVHSWVPGDRDEPRAIYDLLCDPPLPGLERLRAIVDQRGQ